jgi:hypothetical protein
VNLVKNDDPAFVEATRQMLRLVERISGKRGACDVPCNPVPDAELFFFGNHPTSFPDLSTAKSIYADD